MKLVAVFSHRDRGNSATGAHAHLYSDLRWCGPHGIRRQALRRDLFTCQRCGVIVVEGDRKHPHAAHVHHKVKHKGDSALFFDLANTETVCATCHNGTIQREEARGYVAGVGLDGRPVDPNHPWNR